MDRTCVAIIFAERIAAEIPDDVTDDVMVRN
jgi:hypothetical protein